MNRGADQRALVLAGALALSEAFFGIKHGHVSTRHAQMLVTGRIDIWPQYWELADEDRQRVADLLRNRPDELASEEMFNKALHQQLNSDELDGYRADNAGDAIPIHGLLAREHVDRLLGHLVVLRRKRERALKHAGEGRYRTTLRLLRQRSLPVPVRAVYNLVDIREQKPTPVRVNDSPPLPDVRFDLNELLKTAQHIDEAHGEFYRHKRLEAMLTRLVDTEGTPVTKTLTIRSGGLTQLLQAPTGVGKTVLLEVVASLAAGKHLPVAVVVPTRAAALRLTYQIERNIKALGMDAACVPLMSPRRLMEDAEKEAGLDGFRAWAYDRVSYGCALAAAAETNEPLDTWAPGEEPCRDLHEIHPDDKHTPRRACPWRSGCGKFRLFREAVTADVIVTTHQTLFSGSMHIPLETSAGTSERLSVEEFLLRRCQLIMIDEVDSFQESVIDRSARGLVLADGSQETSLTRLDQEFRAAFGQVPPEADGEIRANLSDLRLLAEGYAGNLSGGVLPPVRASKLRRTDHWIVPRGQDAWLTARLLGLPPASADGRAVTPEEVEALQQLYRPGTDSRVDPLQLHGIGIDLAPNDRDGAQEAARSAIRATLRSVASGCRDAPFLVHKKDLSEVLLPVVPDDVERGKVVDRMLRRAYLEPLRARLSELHFYTSHLRAVGAQSATDVADALGGGAQWAAMPASPLGRLFFAFQERLDPDRRDTARLSVAAFGGDPHGYVLYLGELTARGQAGTPRAVIGLSATAYLPWAPRHHVHTPPAWVVPDIDETGVNIRSATLIDADENNVRISGTGQAKRQNVITKAGHLLYPKLAKQLGELQRERDHNGGRGRDKILVATTSYASVGALADGMLSAGAPLKSLCLVTRPGSEPDLQDTRWHLLNSTQIEEFPTTGADILIAPLAIVERGINILDGGISALGSIYLVIRPIPIMDDPSELLAHINHHLWIETPAPVDITDPLDALAARMGSAGRHFEKIVTSAQTFSSLPDWVKRGIVAEIIIGVVQLVGRARRGGTPGQVHLVDYAFTDDRQGASFPRLINELREQWSKTGDLDRLRALYGPTLNAFFDYARDNLPYDGDHA